MGLCGNFNIMPESVLMTVDGGLAKFDVCAFL